MNKVIKLSVMAGACALCVLFSASNVRADELLDLYDSDLSGFYSSSSLYETYDDILLDDGGFYSEDILAEGSLREDIPDEGALYEEPLCGYGLPYEEDMLEEGLVDDIIGGREDDILIETPGVNTPGNSSRNKSRTTTPIVSNPGNGGNGNGKGSSGGSTTPGVTNEMSRALDAINARRASAGAKKLTFSADLNRAAAARVKEITVKFSHVRPNGKTNVSILREFGIDYNCAGENIACCIDSAEDAAAAWATSTTHSRCMLNKDYGHAGIGVTTVDGITYCVLILTD